MNNENHSEPSHPTNSTYAKIAVILAVMTALEVAIFYVGGIPDLVFFGVLISMSIVKFAIVAMYYMHLKFDESIFVYFFGGGIVLASCVIIVLMVLFDQL
jgi:caa(3)-type oxidase subunit IV